LEYALKTGRGRDTIKIMDRGLTLKLDHQSQALQISASPNIQTGSLDLGSAARAGNRPSTLAFRRRFGAEQ
jgi:hypothetical protein